MYSTVQYRCVRVPYSTGTPFIDDTVDDSCVHVPKNNQNSTGMYGTLNILHVIKLSLGTFVYYYV